MIPVAMRYREVRYKGCGGQYAGLVSAGAPLGQLVGFRQEFYECLNGRADALFELAEAVLCADGRCGLWWGCRWCRSIVGVMAPCMTR